MRIFIVSPGADYEGLWRTESVKTTKEAAFVRAEYEGRVGGHFVQVEEWDLDADASVGGWTYEDRRWTEWPVRPNATTGEELENLYPRGPVPAKKRKR